MNCAKCRKHLALHMTGDAPSDVRTAVEAHLASCQACRDELAGLRASVSLLGGIAVTEEMLSEQDPSYFAEVESKLRSRVLDVEHLSLGASWWVGVPRMLAQAAVVAVVAGVVAWLMMFTPERPAAPTQDNTVAINSQNRPAFVFVRPDSQYRQAAVYVPVDDNDTSYSDFNHVVNPAAVRRVQRQLMTMPASYEEDPSRF